MSRALISLAVGSTESHLADQARSSQSLAGGCPKGFRRDHKRTTMEGLQPNSPGESVGREARVLESFDAAGTEDFLD